MVLLRSAVPHPRHVLRNLARTAQFAQLPAHLVAIGTCSKCPVALRAPARPITMGTHAPNSAPRPVPALARAGAGQATVLAVVKRTITVRVAQHSAQQQALVQATAHVARAEPATVRPGIPRTSTAAVRNFSLVIRSVYMRCSICVTPECACAAIDCVAPQRMEHGAGDPAPVAMNANVRCYASCHARQTLTVRCVSSQGWRGRVPWHCRGIQLR
jgi:hypothetical protein